MRGVWRLLSFLAIMLFLAGCGQENLSALDPQGPVADMQFDLLMLSLLVMVFVVLVVVVIFIYVLIKYRERQGDTHIPKQVEGNHRLEIIWTTIPILLLLIIAVPNVVLTFDLADTEPEEDQDVLEVTVTGHQFWWEFEYPEYDIEAGQDLYIPTDTRVVFQLEASDVIHSFWVPALAGKQDTVPGITNEMWLEAEDEGIYQGRCTEFCGESHWLMDFNVIAVDPDTFEAWADSMANPPQELTEPQSEVAAEGRAIYEESCLSCHATAGEGGNPQGGPDLTNFGERSNIAGFLEFNEDNLEEWIRDPQKLKPGNSMPGFDHFDDDEMEALVEYMMGLKVQD
ncbi:cytochrome c oxidase subunit II [Texcoconibacillus texcoconensis]|uniref:Cytochrome c oxidase subunit 2 n=1 Tax=Texcoconibacillus texcoconensis TaxID=1095777 RepID=A0A840QLG5_9BACI|nr:cytochrome c oxidase subunit II [Texcoconibacillus texcoconensis]MBB5172212.1 cytochrome c oxidase subunit 2 [Texcoconibacillus texcoconensis]